VSQCVLVCYVWSGLVRDQVLDITPTFLTSNVLSTLQQVDSVTNQVQGRTGRCWLWCLA